MNHGKKSVTVIVCAFAFGAALAGCARTNPVTVASVPTVPASSQAPQAAAGAADSVPEVVVGASRGDEAEIVVKAARNDPKLVALSEHKAAH